MRLRINTWKNPDCTLGRMTYGDFKCFTLELPWLDNANDVSCIPPGVYKARKYQSPKHGTVILLEDVPDRTFVEIHSGNFTRQILGCILVGDGIKHLDTDSIPDVTNSRNTLSKLLIALPREFEVQIERV